MDPVLEFEKPIVEIEEMIAKLKKLSSESKGDFSGQIEELEKRCREHKEHIYQTLTPWQVVQIARYKDRPILQDYLNLLFADFVELHGDRRYGDDRALIGGLAKFEGRKIMLIGHNKGKNVKDNVERNFGQAKPDGYRKALRLMKLAEKYGLPILTFIDTSGAFPGLDAEERGQHEAIARNLTEMARFGVPIVCLVTGEGGSGGALGIGVGDVILMLQYSVYSVISPEGCAAILWRDGKEAPKAAEALKLTAQDLLKFNVIDEIIPEPLGGAHRNYQETTAAVRMALVKHLDKLCKLTPAKLLEKRFEKYSKMGIFSA